jgi:hypothetical protein
MYNVCTLYMCIHVYVHTYVVAAHQNTVSHRTATIGVFFNDI